MRRTAFRYQFILITLLLFTLFALSLCDSIPNRKKPLSQNQNAQKANNYEGLKKFNDLSGIQKNKEGVPLVRPSTKGKQELEQEMKENQQMKELEQNMVRPNNNNNYLKINPGTTFESLEIQQKIPMSPCAHDSLYENFILDKEKDAPDFLFLHATEPHNGNFYSRILALHPNIEEPRVKEPNFFSFPWISRSSADHYQTLYKNRPFDKKEVLVGDFSSTYLFHPLAPKRIAEQLPKIKIIVVLQDPIQRAYNAYLDRVNQGLENLSFENIIGLENMDYRRLREGFRKCFNEESCNRTNCLPTGTVHAHERGGATYAIKSEVDLKDFLVTSYLFRSIYDDMVERWLAMFPLENFLFLSEEEFLEDKVRTLDTIVDFLRLPKFAFPERDLILLDQLEEEEDIEREMEEKVYVPINLTTTKHLCVILKQFQTRLNQLTGKTFHWCR